MLLGERFALTSWIARLASVSLHLQRSCSACDATLRCPSAVSGWACADSPIRRFADSRQRSGTAFLGKHLSLLGEMDEKFILQM